MIERARGFALMAGVVLLAGCGGSASRPHAPARQWNGLRVAALPMRIAPDLLVRRIRFGYSRTDANGEDTFVASDHLPSEEGVSYGWIVDVETTRESVRWQERLTLPQPTDNWGEVEDDDDVLISRDGRSAYSTGTDLAESGELSHATWLLNVGDPAGRYVMDVAIEGHPVGHVEFELAHPVHEKPLLVRYSRHPGAMPALRVGRSVGGVEWK